MLSLRELSSATQSDFNLIAPKGKVLFPYYRAGVQYMTQCPGNVFNCDDPGLGKTVQSCLFLNHEFEQLDFVDRTALIICPPIAVAVWLEHLKEWLVDKKVKVGEYHPKSAFFKYNILVVSYYWAAEPSLYVVKEILKYFPYTFTIFDEFHCLKNFKSMRRRVCLSTNGYHSKSKKTIALSGTPMPNSPIEFYYPLKGLRPDVLNGMTKHDFGLKFTKAYQDKFQHWHYPKERNLSELYELLASTCMVRRLESKETQAQIAELNGGKKVKSFKTPQIVFLNPDMKLKKLVEHTKKFDEQTYLSSDFNNEDKKEIATLRREIGISKVKICAKYLRSKMREHKKIVVFVHHREVMQTLCEEFNDISFIKIGGGESKKKCTIKIAQFQTNPTINLIFASISAFYQAITLTAASYVAFIEWSYVWEENRQAIKRLARIGQKKQVISEFLALEGGFCERMLLINKNKMKMRSEFT